MSSPIEWHDHADYCGIHVRAHFFDPVSVDARTDFVERTLPVLRSARPRVVASENDGQRFDDGQLCAVPDAVFEHGNGYISLEYKSEGGRGHHRERWRGQLRLKSMLQCLGGAMVVAGHYAKPTTALLRCHNAIYSLDPQQELLDYLAASVPAARAYFEERRFVNVSQLAAYCTARIEQRFRRLDIKEQAAADEGKRRHAELLRL